MGKERDLGDGIKLLENEKSATMKELAALDPKLRSNEITLEVYRKEQVRLNGKIERVIQDLFFLRGSLARSREDVTSKATN